MSQTIFSRGKDIDKIAYYQISETLSDQTTAFFRRNAESTARCYCFSDFFCIFATLFDNCQNVHFIQSTYIMKKDITLDANPTWLTSGQTTCGFTPNYEIHFGTPSDIPSIAQFQVDMAMESEGLPLDLEKVTQGVTHAMEDEAKGKYVIAYADGQAIGSLMLTKEWSDWNDQWYWWIQSVYVRPEYRGKGVYRSMYQTVEKAAREAKIPQIRLYVDNTNLRAQKVYQRVGMHESHYLLYEVEL